MTGRRALQFVLAGRFVNGILHLAETLALRRYVPGTTTAPANLLVCGLWLRSLRRAAQQPS